jgi:hypothetical protein
MTLKEVLIQGALEVHALGRVDGLGRVCGEWIPKFVDL